MNYFYLKQTSCCEAYFYILCFKKGLAFKQEQKKASKSCFGIFETFSWHKLLKLSWKTLLDDKSIYIFGLSFFTLSAKDAKSKFTSVSSIFFLRAQKTEKAILLPFFPFFDLVQKTKKAILLPFFDFFLLGTRNEKKQFYFRFFVFSFVRLWTKNKKTIIVQIFTSGISCYAEMEWEEQKWRWEEWGWVEVRGGWGVASYKQSRYRKPPSVRLLRQVSFTTLLKFSH